MTQRILPLFVALLALVLLTNAAIRAEDKNKDKDKNTHEGLFVSAADGKLTMTDKDGKKEHTHDVAKDAKISCDGKECKLEDLKKGVMVKVTVGKKDDKEMVTKIEAKKEKEKEKDKN